MGRDKEIKIRLTGGEHAALFARRGKMRLATWIRQTALDSVPPTIPEINRGALSELHRIGSNLNQLARAVNSGDAADLIAIRQQVSALRLVLVGAEAQK